MCSMKDWDSQFKNHSHLPSRRKDFAYTKYYLIPTVERLGRSSRASVLKISYFHSHLLGEKASGGHLLS